MKYVILAAITTLTILVAAAPIVKDTTAVVGKRGFFAQYDSETAEATGETSTTEKRGFFAQYDSETADTTGETSTTE